MAPPTSHAPSSRGRSQGSSGSVATPNSAVSSTLPLYTLRAVSTLPAEVSCTQESMYSSMHNVMLVCTGYSVRLEMVVAGACDLLISVL